MGLFIVKEHPLSLNAVASDLTLAKTIQRLAQGLEGHVILDISGSIPIVAGFELLCHDI